MSNDLLYVLYEWMIRALTITSCSDALTCIKILKHVSSTYMPEKAYIIMLSIISMIILHIFGLLYFMFQAPWIANSLHPSLRHVSDFLFSSAVGNFSFDTFANSDQNHLDLPSCLSTLLLSFSFFGHTRTAWWMFFFYWTENVYKLSVCHRQSRVWLFCMRESATICVMWV